MTTMQGPGHFVDLDLDPQEFRKLGYLVVDMMAQYYATVRDFPVLSPHTSQEVEEIFQEPLPEQGKTQPRS